MRCSTLGLTVAAAWLYGSGFAACLDGQVELGAGVGVTIWSDLVHDSIVETIEVGMEPGIAAFFRLGTPLDSNTSVSFRIGFSRTEMVRSESGGTSNIATVVAWSPSVVLSRRVSAAVSFHAAVGIILYASDQTIGTPFRGGEPSAPIVGGGVELALPSLPIFLSVDADAHRFGTSGLREAGFLSDRTVNRVSVTLGWVPQ
ncbi:MAG: hypothetical protein ACE5FJ_01635 [Gemmatimonadales bacterium]